MGYVSLSLMTQKSYLLCSPQSHATKYFDPSLSQFTPKIRRFRFPQPCWPIIIWAMFPSALGFKNHIFFVQSHNTKYFDPSLSQSTLKICRFCFPQPRWPKNKWVSFLSALQPPKKIPLPSASWPHAPLPPSIKPDLWPETRFKRPGVILPSISGILLGTKIGGRNLQFQDPGHAKPWERVESWICLYLLYLLKYVYKNILKKILS